MHLATLQSPVASVATGAVEESEDPPVGIGCDSRSVWPAVGGIGRGRKLSSSSSSFACMASSSCCQWVDLLPKWPNSPPPCLRAHVCRCTQKHPSVWNTGAQRCSGRLHVRRIQMRELSDTLVSGEIPALRRVAGLRVSPVHL